jgi:hypothetical protein
VPNLATPAPQKFQPVEIASRPELRCVLGLRREPRRLKGATQRRCRGKVRGRVPRGGHCTGELHQGRSIHSRESLSDVGPSLLQQKPVGYRRSAMPLRRESCLPIQVVARRVDRFRHFDAWEHAAQERLQIGGVGELVLVVGMRQPTLGFVRVADERATWR